MVGVSGGRRAPSSGAGAERKEGGVGRQEGDRHKPGVGGVMERDGVAVAVAVDEVVRLVMSRG